MTSNVVEQEELIRAIRRRLPPKGNEFKRWRDEKPQEYEEWSNNWRRLCSSELQNRLKAYLVKNYPGSVDDCDDVVQDVLSKFHTKVHARDGYDLEKAGTRGVMPYLLKITKNEMRQRHRAAARIPIPEQEFVLLAVDEDASRQVQDSVDLIDLLGVLKKQLTDQEMLVLKGKLNDLTLEKIGRQLGAGFSTSRVDNIYRRILRKARAILGETDEQNQ